MSLALRDRFLAGDPELPAAVDAIDPEPVARVDGLGVSYFPTARCKAVRFVELAQLPAEVAPLFARAPEVPELAIAFVDPTELSYRTFENIVPLDRVVGAPQITLSDLRTPRPGVHVFRAHGAETLLALDELGLYVPPMVAASRGGLRFIFHAAALGDALTAAVRDALPDLDDFAHVNPVFRCNRFEPTDEKFHRHLDTPYYDRARDHVSRYTLLLYLTGGHGAALDIAGTVLADIAPMTCVIFDQELAHEGTPYVDGRKVFLRSELIHRAEVTHDPAIARAFDRACYLTAESVFAPELARRAHELYDRAAAAHWRGWRDAPEREPLLHKELAGLHFVTNGYDYWFPRSAVSLAEAAAVAVLDTTNAIVGGEPFRARCTTRILDVDRREDVDELLAAHDAPGVVFPMLHHDQLFPPAELVGEDWCCPYHEEDFDAVRQDALVHEYELLQGGARWRIQDAPILVMGREIFLDPSRFVVANGAIHVLSEDAPAPLHFAACRHVANRWEAYFTTEASVHALHELVPPIPFHEGRVLHLMLDLFRNSWMVDRREEVADIPSIVLDPEQRR